MAQSKEYISRFLQVMDDDIERRKRQAADSPIRPFSPSTVKPNRIMSAPPSAPQPVQPLPTMQPMMPMMTTTYSPRSTYRRRANRPVRMPNVSPNGWKG